MASYAAFLRAINLGARRKFPKGDIVAAVEGAGFTDVETYINTGNVRLSTRMRSRERIEATLEQAFLADRGFEVPTLVFSPAELVEVARAAEGLAHEGRHYVYLLREPPTRAAVEKVRSVAVEGERVEIGGRAVHLLVGPDGVHGTKVSIDVVERHLGAATARNRTVIATLAERWGGSSPGSACRGGEGRCGALQVTYRA